MAVDITTVLPRGFNPSAPDASRHTYAQALLDEADTHYGSFERFVVLVATIKNEGLYKLLGFKTFDDLVLKKWGASPATGKRWVVQARELATEGAQKAIGAGETGSRRELIDSPLLPERPKPISQREAARRAAARRNPAPEPAPDTTKSEPATPEDAPRAPRRPQKPPVEAPPPAPSAGAVTDEGPVPLAPDPPRQSSIPPEIEEAIRETEAALSEALPEVVVVPAAKVDEAVRAGTDNPNGKLVIPAEAVPEDWEYPAARTPTSEQVARANLDDLLRFLARFEPAKLAAVAKQADREAVQAFAAHFVVTVPARKAARRETAYVDQKDCKHPVNQRIGSGCGACGKGNLK